MRLIRARLLGIGLLLITALLGGVAGAACGGESPGSPVSPSPSPQREGQETTPTLQEEPSPTSLPGEPSLLYSRLGQAEDILLLAPASRPQEAQQIARVSHAPFWSISAALSPDGQRVAYTVLPPTVPRPGEAASSQAEVWVAPLSGGEAQRIAAGADVRQAPIWSRDGRRLAFRQFGASGSLTLYLADLESGKVSPLVEIQGSPAVFPLAFSPDGGTFYLARAVGTETELLAISVADGSQRTVATLPSVDTRDWRLSPDGTRVSLIAAGGGGWELWVVRLENGELERVQAEGLPTDRALFSPVWHPGGETITLGTIPADGDNGVLNVPLGGGAVERLPGPQKGFDVPLGWSPQGDLLAVYEYSEFPVESRPRLRLITPQGQRQDLGGQEELTFIGWWARGE